MMKLNLKTVTVLLAVAMTATLTSCNQPQDKVEQTGENKSAESGIDRVKNEVFYSRAVNAAIWGMPMVNFDAMRQAYLRDAGAQYNDVIYFSQFANWKFQTTTPNNSTNYVMFFCNLKDGPVVVDVPAEQEAALFGAMVSSWTKALMDVGNNGYDKGKGAKYLLLPPGHKDAVPAGYVPVKLETYNMYALLRVIPKSSSPEDLTKAIAYLQKLKIYPLGNPQKEIRYIDVYDKTYEGIISFDADSYYTSLVRMVKEEPVLQQDLSMMGLMHSIGIGKDVEFKPTTEQKNILQRAIRDAHDYMVNGYATTGVLWWEGRSWLSMASVEMTAAKASGGDMTLLPDREMLDDRAFLYYGVFGPLVNPLPNLYVKTYFDGEGNALNGSNTYKLNVPANVPTTQFWSAIAQDVETAGFIREAKNVGVNSFQELKKNADGSVDVYFSPNPPKSNESNWVSTAEGKPFFVLFRNYGATKEVLERKSPWTLNNVEKVK